MARPWPPLSTHFVVVCFRVCDVGALYREIVHRLPFLDVERSHRLARAFWIPYLSKRLTVTSDYYILRNRAALAKLTAE